MKNLRKFLAVVLAVALAFSLASVAFAADISGYSDASSITQKEAVNVLTTAGVFNGNNGSFNPTGTFTREQAAKVICYLTLGPSVAGSLTTNSSSFKDVSAARWSAPYIQYCTSKGIIGGDGTGNFNPEASVTGVQFAKMLLAAIGYGKAGEYVGSNWAINAISDAVSMGILTLNVNYNAPATREQVAQYALNALTLTSVTFSSTDSAYHSATANFLAGRLLLTKATGQTVNGVLGHTWSYNSLPYFGFYADETALATSTNGTTIANLSNSAAATYKATLANGYAMYVNGQVAVVNTNGNTIALNQYAYDTATGVIYKCTTAGSIGTTAVLSAAVSLKVGDIVNFIDTTPANGYAYADKVSITIQNVDTVASAGLTTVAGINGNPDSISVALTSAGTISGTTRNMFGYSGLAYGDVVTYFVDANGTHFQKATKTSGMLQGYNSAGTQVTVGSTTYTLSTETGASNQAAYIALNGSTMNVYTDANGYAVYVTGTTAPVISNMAVVLSFGDVPASGVTPASVQVKLLMPDGTTKIVTSAQTVATLAGAGLLNSTLIGGAGTQTSNVISAPIATYAINASTGAYTFTTANTGTNTAAIASNIAMFDGTHVANSATVFLVKNGTTYAMYTGIANVPTFASSTYFYNVANGVCSLVYISTPGAISASANTVFFYSLSNTYNYPSAAGAGDDYNAYTALVGTASAASTVKVAPSAVASIAAAGLYTVTYDSLGRVNAATPVLGNNTATLLTATGTTAAASGIVGLGANYYTYASTTPVYYYNPATLILTVKAVADIATDVNDLVAYTLSTSNQITAVYIIAQ